MIIRYDASAATPDEKIKTLVDQLQLAFNEVQSKQVELEKKLDGMQKAIDSMNNG